MDECHSYGEYVKAYSPSKMVRLMVGKNPGETVVVGDDGRPLTEKAISGLKQDANSLRTNPLLGMLIESFKAEAVEVGLVKAVNPEQAAFGKALWHAAEKLEKTIIEISEYNSK